MNDKKKIFIGFDFGGTNIKYILREENNILDSNSFKTEDIENQKYFIKKILEIIDSYLQKYDIKNFGGIGIATKGRIINNIIKSKSCDILNNLNIFEILKQKYNTNIKIVNDASAPFYFYKNFKENNNNNNNNNNKIDKKNIFCVTLGTGLGTSVFISGKQVNPNNFSSEFAKTIFKDNKTNEELCSTRFLVNFANKNNLNISTPKELYDVVINENENNEKQNLAKKIFEKYANNISNVIFQIIKKYNIDEIYFSGGIVKSSKLIENTINDMIKLKSIENKINIPKIYFDKTNLEIGAIGASCLFCDEKQNEIKEKIKLEN